LNYFCGLHKSAQASHRQACCRLNANADLLSRK
jgi:hypothetical protein